MPFSHKISKKPRHLHKHQRKISYFLEEIKKDLIFTPNPRFRNSWILALTSTKKELFKALNYFFVVRDPLIQVDRCRWKWDNPCRWGVSYTSKWGPKYPATLIEPRLGILKHAQPISNCQGCKIARPSKHRCLCKHCANLRLHTIGWLLLTKICFLFASSYMFFNSEHGFFSPSLK